MKKTFLSIVSSIVLINSGYSALVIDFSFGQFFQSSNTSVTMPVGGRVNFLSLNSGTWGNSTTIQGIFTNLTDSFVPAGASLLGAYASDDGGGAGTIGNSMLINLTPEISVGDEILMVVYPTLTLSSLSPGVGTVGFFFRTESIIDGSDIPWIIPTDGFNYNLFAVTENLGGSVPDDQFTAGATATGGAGFTTIPEPSTFALLAIGSGAFLIMRKRRKLS